MSANPVVVASELDEARAAHAKVLKQVGKRIRALDELWPKAKPADRLLAVQRLLQTPTLDPRLAAELEAKNERVRTVLARTRTEKKKLEAHAGDSSQHHKVLQLQLECQRAENDRDELIDESDLRGQLYFWGETFVRTTPFTPEDPALRDLATRLTHLEETIAGLEKRARTGVKFTQVDANGVERTVIRVLPALTLSEDTEPAP
jgi:hypothetical protein